MSNFMKKKFKGDKEQSIRPFFCDQLKVYGVCEGPCLDRHTFCKTLDKECLNIPEKCLVCVKLIKVVSASHFYGRIIKYKTGYDLSRDRNWIIVNDSFEIIKQELMNIGSSPDTKIIHKNFSVGELVMIETEQGKFFRAVILNILSERYSTRVKVKLIDLGQIKEVSCCNIFVLPSHLKEFRPVAIEIVLSSVKPVKKIEFRSLFDWPDSTTQFVCNLLNPFISHDYNFICNVELTSGITLWVEWLLLRKCNECSHLLCNISRESLFLPDELIKRNLARENSQLIDKVNNLKKDVNVWKDEFFNNSKNESLVVEKSKKQSFTHEEQLVKIDKEMKIINLNTDIIVDHSIQLNEKKNVLNSENLPNELFENNSIKMVDKPTSSNSVNPSQQLIPNLNSKIKQNTDVKIVNKYCLDCNVSPFIPQCVWHQDETWIYLRLNILSIKDYKILHTADTITISVETNTVQYIFKSVLFGYIIEDSFTYHVDFNGICMKVQKLLKVKYNWPRLLTCPKKHKYIIFDTRSRPYNPHPRFQWVSAVNNLKIKALGKTLNTVVSFYDSDEFDSDDRNSHDDATYED